MDPKPPLLEKLFLLKNDIIKIVNIIEKEINAMITMQKKPAKCEICNKDFYRGIEQDLRRFCKKCEFSAIMCDECAKNRCPICGNELVNIWEHFNNRYGSPILF